MVITKISKIDKYTLEIFFDDCHSKRISYITYRDHPFLEGDQIVNGKIIHTTRNAFLIKDQLKFKPKTRIKEIISFLD